jgi:hypothetical protein
MHDDAEAPALSWRHARRLFRAIDKHGQVRVRPRINSQRVDLQPPASRDKALETLAINRV